jgi:hypothetical protein
MSPNPSLYRSLRALSHPLTWLALALLLVNDHLLRVLWPSWGTGKLGDFAWLFFAPLVLAALLSLVIPARWKKQLGIVSWVAFLGTTLFFGLAKSLPAFNTLTVNLTEAVIGSPASIRRDLSDLLALAVIPLSYLLWIRQPTHQFRPSLRGYAALPVAALLTIANAAGPNYGVYCLIPYQDQVIAIANRQVGFISSDGGLSWQQIIWDDFGMRPYSWGGMEWQSLAMIRGEFCYFRSLPNGDPDFSSPVEGSPDCGLAMDLADGRCTFPPIITHNTLQNPANPGMVVDYQSGQSIRISKDGGTTWSEEFHLTTSEAKRDYHASTLAALTAPTPLDALIELKTGNTVFAMGLEGILVYQAGTQEFTWVTLSGFEHRDFSLLAVMLAVIMDEFFAAIAFGLLSLSLLTWWKEKSASRKTFTIIAVLVWLYPAIFLRYPFGYDPFGAETFYPIYACIALSGLIAIFLILKSIRMLKPYAGWIFLPNFLLFMIPYLFWAVDILPNYETTRMIALILIAAALVGEYIWINRRHVNPPEEGKLPE